MVYGLRSFYINKENFYLRSTVKPCSHVPSPKFGPFWTFNIVSMVDGQNESQTHLTGLTVLVWTPQYVTRVCSFCLNFHVFQWRANKLVVHATRITWFYNEKSMWNERASFVKKKTDDVCEPTKFQQNEHTPGNPIFWRDRCRYVWTRLHNVKARSHRNDIWPEIIY